jgi:hypothetical protein
LDDWIDDENVVWVIGAFVDELDLPDLDFGLAEATGRPGDYPSALLELDVCGRLNRVRSRRRLETVEHLFGAIKTRLGATRFLMKWLKNVRAEMSLAALADNLTQVVNILGVAPLIQAIRA